MKRTVVKVWDNSQVMGYVVGLKWFNKNGATTKFMSQTQLDRFLTSHNMKIID